MASNKTSVQIRKLKLKQGVARFCYSFFFRLSLNARNTKKATARKTTINAKMIKNLIAVVRKPINAIICLSKEMTKARITNILPHLSATVTYPTDPTIAAMLPIIPAAFNQVGIFLYPLNTAGQSAN